MLKRIVLAVALGALAVSGVLAAQAKPAAAQTKPEIVQRVPPPTDVNDPEAMFREYCTACHGKDGTGNGPAALALKTTPADLTKISARNGGKFPTVKIQRYIEGLDQIAAHGSRDMPVWGTLFRSLPGGQTAIPLRVQHLTDYLQKMQK